MITLSFPNKHIRVTVPLPGSKSESNRALIIAALAGEGSTLHNLASARDTDTMRHLLQTETQTWDVKDAGTTMRFLTAFAAAKGLHKIMIGTTRMCQRPIGILVDALRTLGANIQYLGEEGFPPLEIKAGDPLRGGHLQIRADVSSQYISALLMIAPTLSEGLTLELMGKIGSAPYIQMTLALMEKFGVTHVWENNVIRIEPQTYTATTFSVEGDWSGASYWYSFAALAKSAEISILGLEEDSLQGDSKIASYMTALGIQTTFQAKGILLKQIPFSPALPLTIDFTHTPDLAQTLAVTAGGLGVKMSMTGLESLRIKETDRILALQNELGKFNIRLTEKNDFFHLEGTHSPSPDAIKTYEDHRMAMAFAPLTLKQNTLTLADPEVVNKSYPEFWDHLKLAGATLSYTS